MSTRRLACVLALVLVASDGPALAQSPSPQSAAVGAVPAPVQFVLTPVAVSAPPPIVQMVAVQPLATAVVPAAPLQIVWAPGPFRRGIAGLGRAMAMADQRTHTWTIGHSAVVAPKAQVMMMTAVPAAPQAQASAQAPPPPSPEPWGPPVPAPPR